MILLLSKATGEAEHLRDMLVGNILRTVAGGMADRGDLRRARVFHYVFRKRFLDISMDPQRQRRRAFP